MNYLVIVLRIIHILAGVFWVGGTLIMTFFIAPTIGATAESGQKFIGYLMNNLKFSQRMAAAAGLTILAGLILFGLDASNSAWIRSGAGRGFSIGALFAIIGFVYGMLVGNTSKSMAKLGSQFQSKPTPEQTTQMQTLMKQQATYSKIGSATLIIAVLFMSISRYLVF